MLKYIVTKCFLEVIMYCRNCGQQLADKTVVCPYCGTSTGSPIAQGYTENKSKLVAGLLGIFIGGLGIHNFYLGYQQKAITQLLLSTIGFIIIGPIIAGIWGLIEGIQILTGTIETDAKGNRLTD